MRIEKDTLVEALITSDAGMRFFLNKVAGKLRKRHVPPNFHDTVQKAVQAKDLVNNFSGVRTTADDMMPSVLRNLERKSLVPTKFVPLHSFPVGDIPSVSTPAFVTE
jgi:hypothetical protein